MPYPERIARIGAGAAAEPRHTPSCEVTGSRRLRGYPGHAIGVPDRRPGRTSGNRAGGKRLHLATVTAGVGLDRSADQARPAAARRASIGPRVRNRCDSCSRRKGSRMTNSDRSDPRRGPRRYGPNAGSSAPASPPGRPAGQGRRNRPIRPGPRRPALSPAASRPSHPGAQQPVPARARATRHVPSRARRPARSRRGRRPTRRPRSCPRADQPARTSRSRRPTAARPAVPAAYGGSRPPAARRPAAPPARRRTSPGRPRGAVAPRRPCSPPGSSPPSLAALVLIGAGVGLGVHRRPAGEQRNLRRGR